MQMLRRERISHVVLALVVVSLAACGGADEAEPEDVASPTITVTGVGFATPESVLHDPEADVYLVSNINGAPLEKDDNGFISRVSPEGELLELKWIDGAADGTTLHAPKGMAVQGTTLYVTDIDCVRMFDRTSGAATGEVCPQNVSFLNDIAPAPDGESLFFTDTGLDASFSPTGSDAVYRLSGDDRVTVMLRDPALGGPNGVAVGSRGIFVVTFLSGEVFRLDAEGNRTDVMPGSEGQYDGIEMMDDGGFLLSSWGDQAVYRIAGDGTRTRVLSGVEAPADIGVDRVRNRVLVPLFNGDEVRIVPLP